MMIGYVCTYKLITSNSYVYICTCVMFFSKEIDPDHDISDHHYYDNYTVYSYYCSN